MKTIDVSDRPAPLVMAIESLVTTCRQQMQQPVPGGERPLDWLKGQVTVPHSFFDPLRDDLLDLFKGGSEKP